MWTGLTVLFFTLGVPATPPSVDQAREPALSVSRSVPSRIRWGVQIGLLGQGVVGSGVTAPGGETEYDPNLSFFVEPFVFEYLRSIELAPFLSFRFAGGINEDLVESALTDEEEISSSFDYDVGLGIRFHPFEFFGVRPTIGLHGAYALSVVNVANPSLAPPAPGAPPVTPPTRTAREAFALGGSMGLRTEVPFQGWFNGAWTIAVEGRYTHYFWGSLETSVPEVLNPSDLDLDRIGVAVSTGLRLP
ncbi:MAG: hypothetical protein ACFB9M_17905 [Myxococcota bacterium]